LASAVHAVARRARSVTNSIGIASRVVAVIDLIAHVPLREKLGNATTAFTHLVVEAIVRRVSAPLSVEIGRRAVTFAVAVVLTFARFSAGPAGRGIR
jgi:hypothetical protein